MLREKPILSLSKLRRLAEIMDERMKAPVVAEVKVKKFSTFVTEWKTAERAALGRSTMQHYSNAFQSYVLTDIRRPGHPVHQPEIHSDVVISGIARHSKVELAAEVYDKASATDMRQALGVVGKQLLPGDPIQ
jgi:hypothetical protein